MKDKQSKWRKIVNRVKNRLTLVQRWFADLGKPYDLEERLNANLEENSALFKKIAEEKDIPALKKLNKTRSKDIYFITVDIALMEVEIFSNLMKDPVVSAAGMDLKNDIMEWWPTDGWTSNGFISHEVEQRTGFIRSELATFNSLVSSIVDEKLEQVQS